METIEPYRPATGPDPAFTERLKEATRVLEEIIADRGLLAGVTQDERRRLMQAAAQVYHPDHVARRRLVKETARQRKVARADRDDGALHQTGIRKLRRQEVFTTPNVYPPSDFRQEDIQEPEFREAVEPQHCYICKQDYTAIHHFYDQLCPACSEFNFAKRGELADLSGRVALLTGGRVKIGYQAGIKLLRSGARLIVTTRFPRDSAARYAHEPDFSEWGHRVRIYGLDLRHTPSVEAFCREILASTLR